jgi:hypothetical protein
VLRGQLTLLESGKNQKGGVRAENKYGKTGQKSLDKKGIWRNLQDLYGRKALTEDG